MHVMFSGSKVCWSQKVNVIVELKSNNKNSWFNSPLRFDSMHLCYIGCLIFYFILFDSLSSSCNNKKNELLSPSKVTVLLQKGDIGILPFRRPNRHLRPYSCWNSCRCSKSFCAWWKPPKWETQTKETNRPTKIRLGLKRQGSTWCYGNLELDWI